MINLRQIASISPLILILGVGLYMALYGNLPPSVLYLAYAIVIAAIIISFLRGGVESYLFWITVIAGYPLLVPLISMDLFDLPYFSSRARGFQEAKFMVTPILIGSLSALYLSLSVSSARIYAFGSGHRNPQEKATDDLLFWLIISVLGMLVFAYLAEPSFTFIGKSSYKDIIEGRLGGARFAAGAWGAFFLFSLALYAKLIVSSKKILRLLAHFSFWSGTMLSMLWLLSHARRVEPIGILILLLCVFGNRVSTIKKVMFGSFMLVLLTLIGYIRSLRDPVSLLIDSDFLSLPGGPENLLVAFVSGFSLVSSGYINIIPGESYIGLILRLPPSLLGLERPFLAYDYVYNMESSLIGGEYYLLEPFMNFGITGIVIYLLLFSMIANWSIKTVHSYWENTLNTTRYLMAGVFFILIFRTLWYGLSSLSKGVIMVSLIGFSFFLLRTAVRKMGSSRYAVQKGSELFRQVYRE